MKKIIIGISIIGFILLGIFFWPTKPSQDLPEANFSDSIIEISSNQTVEIISTEPPEINLEITGFGPGKSHTGFFSDYTITDFAVDQNGKPQTGKLTIKSSSLDFGIENLNKHLCANDFLDCENYPEIYFELSDFIQQDNNLNSYIAIGNLIFKDNISTVGFPVTKVGDDWNTDFRLNIKNIGVTYIGIDDEIQIKANTKKLQ